MAVDNLVQWSKSVKRVKRKVKTKLSCLVFSVIHSMFPLSVNSNVLKHNSTHRRPELPDANTPHVNSRERPTALCCNYSANHGAAGEPSRTPRVLRESCMEARQFSLWTVPSLPLSLRIRGPKGGASVASHVLTLANDKVAATGFMNYAG